MKNTSNWKLYLVLTSASILSVVAVLPYAFTLAGDILKQAPFPLPVLMIISIIQSSVLFAVVIFFGLKLSKKIGLGLPFLEEYLVTKKLPSNFKSVLKISIIMGIIAGVAIIFLDFIFSKLGVGINLWTGQLPPVWMGFLASFYGGISEEILLRLFFMSFLVWIFSKFRKTDNGILNNNLIMWSSIIIASIIFGLGHLPITETMTPLTSLVVSRAILLNGVGGIIFGWLFWKKGLESAIMAHFSTDIVLHVIFPLLLI
ncbi:MAG: CPBP family glutamic-type intramembrane protease [Patescibacteria group bacterium]|jgi:membrane protease YdiL (CAAX protease family)|nr:CPBP family glutamic-type intramembrane protease [Patescibacteria group bacterium]